MRFTNDEMRLLSPSQRSDAIASDPNCGDVGGCGNRHCPHCGSTRTKLGELRSYGPFTRRAVEAAKRFGFVVESSSDLDPNEITVFGRGNVEPPVVAWMRRHFPNPLASGVER